MNVEFVQTVAIHYAVIVAFALGIVRSIIANVQIPGIMKLMRRVTNEV